MSTHSQLPLSHDDLQILFDRLGTWKAVAAHLGIPVSVLRGIRGDLGLLGSRRHQWRRKSSLLPFKGEIAALAAKGLTCREITETLDLPVQPEQVRRFMHKNSIPLLARQGAQPGEKHRDWKGGRKVDKSGYILVRAPDHPHASIGGYVREHRLVMEAHLGRHLTPGEVVHHINGEKADNRIENLELYASNGEHLAETLKGRCPEWSDEGRERIALGVKRARQTRRSASPSPCCPHSITPEEYHSSLPGAPTPAATAPR